MSKLVQMVKDGFQVALLGLAIGLSVALIGCQSPTATPAATTAPQAQAPAPAATQAAGQASTVPAQAPATPATAAQPAQETLRLGVSIGLTGPGAAKGISGVKWAQLAVDDINAKGGVKVGGKSYRLELVVVDDKYAADGARDAVNRLVLAEKVRYIFGHCTPCLAAAQPVAEPNKVLLLASGNTKQTVGPSHSLSFQVVTPDPLARGQVIYEWFSKERPDVKRVAVMNSDDGTGRNQAEFSKIAAKARGIDVVSEEYYPVDMKDADAVAARVLRTKPDAIDNPSSSKPPLWILTVQALRNQGFKGQIFGQTVDPVSLSKGFSYLEGYTGGSLVDYKSSAVGAGVQEVFSKYIQKHGESDLDPSTAVHYPPYEVLAQAIEKAGTVEDTEKIAKVLREGQWDSMYSKGHGKLSFGGQKTYGLASVMNMPIFLSRQENGKGVTFGAIMTDLP